MKQMIMVAVIVVVVVLLAILIWRRRSRRKLKPEHFAERWLELQKKCASRKTWPHAIVEADDLLHDALRARKYKGKTTGEKLVAAQRDLSSNEAVWYGHKMRNKVINEDVRKLKKQDMLQALGGFRQALRDLEVLDK